jgi:hypothetical protein
MIICYAFFIVISTCFSLKLTFNKIIDIDNVLKLSNFGRLNYDRHK